jgi:hypothetical protein
MERLLGRSISTDLGGKPVLWGKLLEPRLFDMLGLEYTYCSDDTQVHPTIPYWSGTRDGYKEDTIIDEKCPFTLKSFCQLVQPLYEGETGMVAMNNLRVNHPDGEKYYWQLVSGSILSGTKYAELIIYMPYLSELDEIKIMADGNPKYYWLNFAGEDELPYLIDGGYYRNLNIINFEVPEWDKRILTEAILKAGEMLLGNKVLPPSVFVAGHDKEVDATIVTQMFDHFKPAT